MGQENNKQHISFLNARVTSIISISLVLFLLGIVVSLSVLGTQLTKHIKENMGFTIVIKDSASKRGIESVKRELDKAPYVKAVQFISKEDALKELELELGESPKDLLGFNPLQSSIEIYKEMSLEYSKIEEEQQTVSAHLNRFAFQRYLEIMQIKLPEQTKKDLYRKLRNCQQEIKTCKTLKYFVMHIHLVFPAPLGFHIMSMTAKLHSWAKGIK